MSKHINTDICVIGGGSGGLSVAAGAAQMGAQTVLIEGHKMGGDCLNYGCVPSKALLAAAGHAVAGKANAAFGLSAPSVRVDFAKVMAHVKDTIAAIEPVDSVERFAGLGVNVIEGRAKFIDRKTVKVGTTTIRAKRFVIATGSQAAIPPIKGLKSVNYLTNETLFDLTRRPKHLLVLGGGPIGVEMAQAFARLGSKVTLLEAGQLLGREDPELVAHVRVQLLADGVTLYEGVRVDAVAAKGKAATQKITVSFNGTEVTGDQLLVAAGRAPICPVWMLKKPECSSAITRLRILLPMRACAVPIKRFSPLAMLPVGRNSPMRPAIMPVWLFAMCCFSCPPR